MGQPPLITLLVREETLYRFLQLGSELEVGSEAGSVRRTARCAIVYAVVFASSKSHYATVLKRAWHCLNGAATARTVYVRLQLILLNV